jgi:hypothetical protein
MEPAPRGHQIFQGLLQVLAMKFMGSMGSMANVYSVLRMNGTAQHRILHPDLLRPPGFLGITQLQWFLVAPVTAVGEL